MQPRFQATQNVYENLSFLQKEHHLEEIFVSGSKLADFQALMAHYDPQGKFRNCYLNRYISER